MTLSPERIRSLPRAELHVHLDGSLRPETLLELAGDAGVTLPAREPAALADAMRADDTRDLSEYLARFEITLSVMQTPSALERIAGELVEDHALEGVWYVEIRYSPVLCTAGGMSLEEAVEAPLAGLRDAEARTGIEAALIICGIRNLAPATSARLAELAVAYRDEGVVGFDLAGGEAGNPAHHHLRAFQIARNGDLGVTIHAGEGWGAASIRDAIQSCGAHRIGHGTRLHEDPSLERYARDFQVPLEVCLTSNVQTGVSPTLEDHPVRRYFDLGIPVTLCTDNRLMSATTVAREYELAHRHLGFMWEEMVDMARTGFEKAFLPWNRKQALLDRFHRRLEGRAPSDP